MVAISTKLLLGYYKNEYVKLVISEEQAKIVRRIFDIYISRNKSILKQGCLQRMRQPLRQKNMNKRKEVKTGMAVQRTLQSKRRSSLNKPSHRRIHLRTGFHNSLKCPYIQHLNMPRKVA